MSLDMKDASEPGLICTYPGFPGLFVSLFVALRFSSRRLILLILYSVPSFSVSMSLSRYALNPRPLLFFFRRYSFILSGISDSEIP